jgi:hypothetical protein
VIGYVLSPRVGGGESEAELIWVRLGEREFEDTNGVAVWITQDLDVPDNGHDDKGC